MDYDLIVVGAGINGVGIALDASLRGLRVALVEKDDICSGVSAWSGRLVHGGLRYLEHYDFGLVRESLVERERLFRNAPHLVRPVPLLMPSFSHNRRSRWLVEVGMVLYDTLSFGKTPPMHRMLGRERVERRFPGMSREGLKGAALFYDGQVELAERLCVELPLLGLVAFALVEEREARFLERGEVAANRARGDTGRARELMNRHARPRGFHLAEDLPLADDFGVSHAGATRPPL